MNAYAHFTDAELAQKLNLLDKTAFAEVYDRYWAVLYSHARRLLRDNEQAGDVVQDIFTSLLQNMGKLNPAIPLSSYLYASVRNRIISMIRHDKVQMNYLTYLKSYTTEGVYATDDIVRERELKEQIEREVALLPPKMRAVFEMSRRAHLSHKEIADNASISEETVKRQISFALKILRSKLSCWLLLYIMSSLLMLNKLLV
jgi:RNA polymerase sigma-70 factor (ECF subfamily)